MRNDLLLAQRRRPLIANWNLFNGSGSINLSTTRPRSGSRVLTGATWATCQRDSRCLGSSKGTLERSRDSPATHHHLGLEDDPLDDPRLSVAALRPRSWSGGEAGMTSGPRQEDESDGEGEPSPSLSFGVRRSLRALFGSLGKGKGRERKSAPETRWAGAPRDGRKPKPSERPRSQFYVELPSDTTCDSSAPNPQPVIVVTPARAQTLPAGLSPSLGNREAGGEGRTCAPGQDLTQGHERRGRRPLRQLGVLVIPESLHGGRRPTGGGSLLADEDFPLSEKLQRFRHGRGDLGYAEEHSSPTRAPYTPSPPPKSPSYHIQPLEDPPPPHAPPLLVPPATIPHPKTRAGGAPEATPPGPHEAARVGKRIERATGPPNDTPPPPPPAHSAAPASGLPRPHPAQPPPNPPSPLPPARRLSVSNATFRRTPYPHTPAQPHDDPPTPILPHPTIQPPATRSPTLIPSCTWRS
ncbi:hypothetical protein C7M84_018600 [Penaeus vannamei]|uniref:Uncharacterized protein n=1 Tax=Penaeus vannamei TaxID=6689 RepID=A0A423SGX1_PENVA|nr:hypothetical protein C7M84_018600 [Penaeus vannamei]